MPIDSKFPVVVTSYEILLADVKFMAKYHWKYIVVDEVRYCAVHVRHTCYRCILLQLMCHGNRAIFEPLESLPNNNLQGHRLKNMNCKLIRELKTLPVENKLLLTGGS